MHSNYAIRQSYARLLREAHPNCVEEEDLDELTVKLNQYIDAQIAKLKPLISKMIDEKFSSITNQNNSHIIASIVGGAEKVRDDTFTFDCKKANFKTFELKLVEKDFDKLALINPVPNAIYKIGIHASKRTAPHRIIKGQITSLNKDVVTVRSDFQDIHVQMNRSYLMLIHIIEVKGKLLALLTVEDYCTDGALAKFGKKL
jgi:hypothetical protein